jgi:hypothetical protein
LADLIESDALMESNVRSTEHPSAVEAGTTPGPTRVPWGRNQLLWALIDLHTAVVDMARALDIPIDAIPPGSRQLGRA